MKEEKDSLQKDIVRLLDIQLMGFSMKLEREIERK
jgi:hypothetical protein